jgi:hypothetical protein
MLWDHGSVCDQAVLETAAIIAPLMWPILSNKLTRRSWALPERPPVVLLLKNFLAFYVTQRFTAVFTKALNLSLSWARPIQSTPPHWISLRSILMLSTHLRFGLASGFFLPDCHQYPACIPPLPIRSTCSDHPILLDLIILIMLDEEHKL